MFFAPVFPGARGLGLILVSFCYDIREGYNMIIYYKGYGRGYQNPIFTSIYKIVEKKLFISSSSVRY